MLRELALLLFTSTAIHRVLVDSEIANTPSLRGIAKAGFRPLASATYVQVGSCLLLHWVRPWSPHAG